MGALLITCCSKDTLVEKLDHPLLKGDGTYVLTKYEKRLAHRVKLCILPVLAAFGFTAVVTYTLLGPAVRRSFLLGSIPTVLQCLLTALWVYHPRRLRSYRWVVTLRLTTEFFLVLLIARYMSQLAIGTLACELEDNAFKHSDSKPESCSGLFMALNVIAVLLYASPTTMQIHFLRQVQRSYENRMRDDIPEYILNDDDSLRGSEVDVKRYTGFTPPAIEDQSAA